MTVNCSSRNSQAERGPLKGARNKQARARGNDAMRTPKKQKKKGI